MFGKKMIEYLYLHAVETITIEMSVFYDISGSSLAHTSFKAYAVVISVIKFKLLRLKL